MTRFIKKHISWPQPLTYFVVLTIIVLLLPSIVIPYWYITVKRIEHDMVIETVNEIASNVDNVARLSLPVNSSAKELASILGSNHDKQLRFSYIVNKVAPLLLEAILITPYSTEASYIGLDGLFFSYYKFNNEIYTTYANSTFPPSNSTSIVNYTWYTQPLDSESRRLTGEPKVTKPVFILNQTWFQNAVNSSNGYASLGYSWTSNNKGELSIFTDSVKLGDNGVVSVGYSVKRIADLFTGVGFYGGGLYMASGDNPGRVILNGIKGVRVESGGDRVSVFRGSNDEFVGEVACVSRNGSRVGSASVKIGGMDFVLYCEQIEVARVGLVYAFAFPRNSGLTGEFNKHTKAAFILFIVMMVAMVILVFVFVTVIVRAAWREVQLCAAYMRQMDKTAQAERKSLKQTLAFANANHDIRGYVSIIKGLIDLMSDNEVSLSPDELASNFKMIHTCADDLLAMVNPILDFSKIEAKKTLEEENFDMEELLEELADSHCSVAIQKGIELILDPCDGSLLKFSSITGDKAKLKQILSNLLSNAVKYTPNGHIYIRAWAKKPSLENSIIASNNNSFLSRLSRIFFKNKEAYKDLDGMRMVNSDSNSMEFVFEVEDTGLGIPKDKRKSIFENFVQVKENSSGQVGTGLGLGIVQSLVRLMGGDIEIIDKANGEKGACFRFNIFLTVRETPNHPRLNKQPSQDRNLISSPRVVEGSAVVLLMKDEERRKMVQHYMETLGIKVIVLKQANRIAHALKTKLKLKLTNPPSNCQTSSSGSYSWSPRVPLSTLDGADDHNLPVSKPASFHGALVRCILLIIDANAGDFQEMCRSVADLRKVHLETCIKVVWLEKRQTRMAHFPGLADDSLPHTDRIYQDPLHGDRLFRVIELLPEFGGELVLQVSSRRKNSSTVFPQALSSENEEGHYYSSSGERLISRARSGIFRISKSLSSGSRLLKTRSVRGEIEELEDSGRESCKRSPLSIKRSSSLEKPPLGPPVSRPSSNNKPLAGKRFLVAEDIPIGRTLARKLIEYLGGEADVRENGEKAFESICEELNKLTDDGASKFPYDYVLMDCQMPVMDGFEATRRIREEEKKYGIHIPVIALTADEVGEAGNKIREAGMDFHITKPLSKDGLLEAMKVVDRFKVV